MTVHNSYVYYRHKTNKDTEGHLYSAINKYGIDNFEFTILKEIGINDDTQKHLNYYEIKYIEEYNSTNKNIGYNKKSGGSRGKHSEESNEKNRLAHIGKSVNKGVPKTEESKIKLSKTRIERQLAKGKNNPMYNKKHSDETKEKMKIKAKLRPSEKNPMYGKSVYSVWLKKYGKDIADKKMIERNKKASISLSKVKKNLKEVICPHCNLTGKGSGMTRYHFDKCKRNRLLS